MKEAEGFDILLESARYILGIAPETRSVEFVGDILHYETNFGQPPSRLGGGTEGKCAIVAGRLVQNPMDEKDDLFGGRRYVAARLRFWQGDKNRPCYLKPRRWKTYLNQSFSPVVVLVQVLSECFKGQGDCTNGGARRHRVAMCDT